MTLNYDSKKISRQRIAWHIIFWIAYTVFIATVYGSFERDYGQRFVEVLIQLPLRIFVAYFTVYFLVMRVLLKKKYTLFAILLIISIFVFALLQRIIYYEITFPLYYPDFLNSPLLYWPAIFKGIINLYTVTIALLSIKFLKQWYENQNIKQQLEKEKAQAELKLLKAQIHPHFLFNTLNNLYALTLKKSDKAPEVVLKLSHLLNYILYDCNARYVPIKKEVEMLQNYIELEKIRYGKRLMINFDVEGSLTGIQIAPLILLPFVENSFKHGTSGNIEKPEIEILLHTSPDEVIFQIENTKDSEKKQEQSYQEGIGLKNVRRRLELLHYENYELTIEEKSDKFFVLLVIKIQN